MVRSSGRAGSYALKRSTAARPWKFNLKSILGPNNTIFWTHKDLSLPGLIEGSSELTNWIWLPRAQNTPKKSFSPTFERFGRAASEPGVRRWGRAGAATRHLEGKM